MLYELANGLGPGFEFRIYHPKDEDENPVEAVHMLTFFTRTSQYTFAVEPDGEGAARCSGSVESRMPRTGEPCPRARGFASAVPFTRGAWAEFLTNVVMAESVTIQSDDFWKMHKLQIVPDPGDDICALCGAKLQDGIEYDGGVCDACVKAEETEECGAKPG